MIWRVVVFLVTVVGVAAGQNNARTDALGPHGNSGRACSSCHVTHSPSSREKSVSAAKPLWGENDARAYGAGAMAYVTARTPERIGILLCLSCHDGNYAIKAPTKDRIYEILPDSYSTYGGVRTLADTPNRRFGRDNTVHPVGLDTKIGCGGPGEWDCTTIGGVIIMNGAKSAKFVSNYGFFNKRHPYEGRDVLVCSTCHNPHSENTMLVTESTQSKAYRPGTYTTISFLRAPYDPNNASISSNQTAQYCRQCHADRANETYGSNCGTLM